MLDSYKVPLLTLLAIFISSVVLITTRHAQLSSRRRTRQWPQPSGLGEAPRSIQRKSENEYNLFVLGSGGHTKEMLMMMDDGFCDFKGFHRRYLISSGDTMSNDHLESYENELKMLCEKEGTSFGTYDKRTVTRARRVHQPLYTTPLTAFLSIADIFPVLLSPPSRSESRRLRYPSQIFSNGPATGFFVALTAYLLKLFHIAPEDSMKFVFIESWARISTLSLTGKLLYYTGLADVFLVQHAEVAAKYGVENAGEMVFNSRRPDM